MGGMARVVVPTSVSFTLARRSTLVFWGQLSWPGLKSGSGQAFVIAY